jgi:hypothetical protein
VHPYRKSERKTRLTQMKFSVHKEKRRKDQKTAMLFIADDFNRCVIQNVTEDFYQNLKMIPTCKKIL